jgi:hypothetical protein
MATAARPSRSSSFTTRAESTSAYRPIGARLVESILSAKASLSLSALSVPTKRYNTNKQVQHLNQHLLAL